MAAVFPWGSGAILTVFSSLSASYPDPTNNGGAFPTEYAPGSPYTFIRAPIIESTSVGVEALFFVVPHTPGAADAVTFSIWLEDQVGGEAQQWLLFREGLVAVPGVPVSVLIMPGAVLYIQVTAADGPPTSMRVGFRPHSGGEAGSVSSSVVQTIGTSVTLPASGNYESVPSLVTAGIAVPSGAEGCTFTFAYTEGTTGGQMAVKLYGYDGIGWGQVQYQGPGAVTGYEGVNLGLNTGNYQVSFDLNHGIRRILPVNAEVGATGSPGTYTDRVVFE